jgi:hypothetical protein
MASLDVVVYSARIPIFIIISLGDGGRKDARTSEKLLKAPSIIPMFNILTFGSR